MSLIQLLAKKTKPGMRYSASPAILQNDDLSQVAWDAIEPIWYDLPLSPSKKMVGFLDELSEGQRGLIALDWCQKEIRNGGFLQLFVNSTGNLVPWAIEGFQMIGAANYAKILARAAGMLGADYPTSATARMQIIGLWSSVQVQELDRHNVAFYTLLNSPDEELERYRGTFVKSHPNQFIESNGNG